MKREQLFTPYDFNRIKSSFVDYVKQKYIMVIKAFSLFFGVLYE